MKSDVYLLYNDILFLFLILLFLILSIIGEKMNELDALRQEAETLKNAIRVSISAAN